ncbi:ATP-binding protein [Psychromonas sp. SP041]|uniref:ATP-binding protein n=1 Tax=Psychromonas sp. SP041 TaxID=1365007 RepID=UPI0004022FE6|nr:ATP-binding protein [Psychromonas sp. SP041]
MKIHNKLFFVFFSFSLLLVGALVLLIQWSINKGVIDYVNSKDIEALKPLVTQLEKEYKKEDSWQGLRGHHKRFGDILFLHLQGEFRVSKLPSRPNGPPRERALPLNNMERGGPFIESDRPPRGQASFALFDHNKNLITGYYDKNVEYNKTPINVNEVNVGWLMLPKQKKITDGYELDLLDQLQNYLWIIAVFTMILVALITFPIAHHIAEPIKKIILGMHKLTQGDYQQNIALNRKDELGELSRDFNELALTLHENEDARKRWFANISHELRTPVAILRGELEAMLDGVRPINEKNIDSANDEVKHLQHLIDDLDQLTSVDIGGMHYRKQTVNISTWFESEVDKYTGYLAAANIALVIDNNKLDANIFADTTRLCQLFDNLVNNSIKYSAASIAKISLEIDSVITGSIVRIKVEDNGVGVEDLHLPRLFEYLYRIESSRNRKTGGSGLGLSICAHIVTAHQGSIKAVSSDLGGLGIIIELPLEA